MNLMLIKDGDEEFFATQAQMYFLIMSAVGIFYLRDTEFITNIIGIFSIETYGVPLYVQLMLALPISIFFSFLWLYFKSKRKKGIFDFGKELFLVILMPLIYLILFGLYLKFNNLL